MQYKIGSHIVIKKSNIEEISQYAGRTGVIVDFHENTNHYLILVDDNKAKIWCEVSGLVEEKKVFTKNDLKNGDVIKKRNGSVEIVVLPLGTLVTNDKISGFNILDDIRDDLTSSIDDKYDVVAVRRPTEVHHCRFSAFKDELGDLVYDRERDTKPLYNGKVVCVDLNGIANEDLYTVGKIYQFNDGKIVCNDDTKIPYNTKIYSFEDCVRFSNSKWIEIKE